MARFKSGHGMPCPYRRENQLADRNANVEEQHRRAGEASLAQNQGGGKPPHSLNCRHDRADDGAAPFVANAED